MLEKANAIAPRNLYNELYLAEVLLDQGEVERATVLLQDIIHADDIRHDIAIDAYLKNQARKYCCRNKASTIQNKTWKFFLFIV